MLGWEFGKKAFDAWENATAQLLETILKSPLILVPSGALLSVVMKARVARNKAITDGWSSAGLATRRDQERILHALNQIQSRLMDLEEKLAEKD